MADGAALATADAGDGDAPSAPPNLLANGGFEAHNPACAPGWTIQIGVADPVMTSHSGSWSCRICSTSASEAYYGLDLTTPFPAKVGSWTLDAYARAETDAGTPIELDVRIAANGGMPTMTAQLGLSSSWARGQASIDVVTTDAATPQVVVSILAMGPPGSCFLVDDVSLTYVP